jgi:hypothetical protein
MNSTPEEFLNAIHIVKPHRYCIEKTERGSTLRFGLLGSDGVNHYFKIHSDDVPYFGIELHELARTTKYVARTSCLPLMQSHIPVRLPLAKDGSLEPFVGPEMKLHRSAMHFGDLEDIIIQYSNRAQVSTNELEQNNGLTTWEICFSEPPPASIPLILGDVVHNLRSALDLMVCDLARIQGEKVVRNLEFPFDEDESALMKRTKRKKLCAYIGQDAFDAIISLRPYAKNGSELLHGLHKLDITDKHQLIIPTYWAAWHKYDFAEAIADQIVKNNPEIERPKIVFITDEMDRTFFKEGDRIQKPVGEHPLKYYVPEIEKMQVRFAHNSTNFAGEPILETLAKLVTLVQKILSDFRTKFQAGRGL